MIAEAQSDSAYLLILSNIFFALISAWIGARIGISWTKHQFQEQEKAENEKIRKSILESLNFNRERSTQAKKQLNEGGMPNYPLDGTRLSNLIVQAHGYLAPETLRALDWHRYQLDHITAKLGVINDFFLGGQTIPEEAKKAHQIWMTMLRDSMIEHYDEVIRGTKALVEAVENEPRKK